MSCVLCRCPLFIFINMPFVYVICKLISIGHESPLNKDEKAFFYIMALRSFDGIIMKVERYKY